MDKKKSFLNVFVSVGFKIITMVMVILVKRLLIDTCGNDVNGLNALYLSVVGFLSVAELGVGSAITFCMYKPIVEDDRQKISALYRLFQRVYCIIGGVILLAGLIMAPFIHHLAADYTSLDVNLSVTFVLMLISVVVTYFFGAKTALINAYKNNYITTAISSSGIILQYILQIVTLLVTRSFSWYLVCRIVAAAVQWLITELAARKRYKPVMAGRGSLDAETRKDLMKNIKAMFMHRIGTLLVTTADNVIISMFVGVVALGGYSNYSTIMVSMTGVLKLVFSSLTSVFGHLYVEKDKQTAQAYCERFHFLNFAIGMVFYLGYYAVIDNLIAILFGEELVAVRAVALVVTANGFVQFLRTNVITFREATGTFYHDRWKPLIEGVANIILSVLFVKWIGLVGVIVATVITNLLICHVVEPFVLYRYAFDSSPKKFYWKNYGMILLFGCALLLMHICTCQFESQWLTLVVNGCISVGISLAICLVMAVLSKDTKAWIKSVMKRGKHGTN